MVQVAPLRPGKESRENQRHVLEEPWSGRWGRREPLEEARQGDAAQPAEPLLCLRAHSRIGERDGRREGAILASTSGGEREGGG